MPFRVHGGIWQVTFVFSTTRVVAPRRTRVGDEASLDGFLRRVGGDPSSLDGWPSPEATVIAREEALHLSWQLADVGDEIVSCYLFDGSYAAAHPEAMDDDHLAIVHGTVAAKMFDDGAMVLERDGLIASLRWPPLERAGVRLTRAGSRE